MDLPLEALPAQYTAHTEGRGEFIDYSEQVAYLFDWMTQKANKDQFPISSILEKTASSSYHSLFSFDLKYSQRRVEPSNYFYFGNPFTTSHVDKNHSLEDLLGRYLEYDELVGDNQIKFEDASEKCDTRSGVCMYDLAEYVLFACESWYFCFQTFRSLRAQGVLSFPESVDLQPYAIPPGKTPEEYVFNLLLCLDLNFHRLLFQGCTVYDLVAVFVEGPDGSDGFYMREPKKYFGQRRWLFHDKFCAISVSKLYPIKNRIRLISF